MKNEGFRCSIGPKNMGELTLSDTPQTRRIPVVSHCSFGAHLGETDPLTKAEGLPAEEILPAKSVAS